MQPDHVPGQFRTTHWSVVLSAKNPDSPESDQAIATLCETYWYPLYAYVRRAGHSPEDAEDLTQGFFARFLEKRALLSVDRSKGKFRSFLLACLKHFLHNEWEKSQSLKRGGTFSLVSLNFEYGENRYRREPAHEVTPDKLFERSWAEVLLKNVLDRLRNEYAAVGKGKLFDLIHPYLEGNRDQTPYGDLAKRLGMGLSATKMAVLRLRRRYGEFLRQEIGQTVATPEEVDDEIRHLFTAIG
jgi:RNA polymerase sigma-70 factor (ECF subfamily)